MRPTQEDAPMSLRTRSALVLSLFIAGTFVLFASAGDHANVSRGFVTIEDQQTYGYCNGAYMTYRDNRPVLSFGLYKPAKGKTHYKYIVLFKSPPGPRPQSYEMG